MKQGKQNTIKHKFLERDLSWINYNSRVLEEGLRNDIPLLDRFRFLSIVSSNFSEFFMVRIAALKRTITESADPALIAEAERILHKAREMIRPQFEKLYKCLNSEIFPALAQGGLELRRPPFNTSETAYLKPLFFRDILPVLTPLRFGAAVQDACENNLNAIANGCIYGAFLLKKLDKELFDFKEEQECISIVEIPRFLDRVILVDSDVKQNWALLDDLLLLWGDHLFSGYEVKERLLFRIFRDADFSVDEQRDDDFIEAMEEVLVNREKSPAIQMIYSLWNYMGTFDTLSPLIIKRLGLLPEDAFEIQGPLALSSLDSLTRIKSVKGLKKKMPKPVTHPAFSPETPIWDTLRAGDALVSLPYQSFDPVVRFFQEAAEDPKVLSIKTTLYRTSGESPIIRALEQAALNGKQVSVLVELKARFDEERNISWANRLERAGVMVIYGLAHLKVHAKMSQVIRREETGIKRYLHFSTGNYNDKTARLYSDVCLFSCREELGNDATAFFNMLSGYSSPLSMESLVIAPTQLKQHLISLIDREAKRAKEGASGLIVAKMNALSDTDVIDALYRASKAGVRINLNIRGICTLVPGVPSLSENIKVVSIVDYYLEHSRIFYFNNGGAEEFFISSADWMPRNLERRVELLVPVKDEKIQDELRQMLKAYFKDNTQAWTLDKQGKWKHVKAQSGEHPYRAQEYLQGRAIKDAEQSIKTRQEFTVRRSYKRSR